MPERAWCEVLADRREFVQLDDCDSRPAAADWSKRRPLLNQRGLDEVGVLKKVYPIANKRGDGVRLVVGVLDEVVAIQRQQQGCCAGINVDFEQSDDDLSAVAVIAVSGPHR